MAAKDLLLLREAGAIRRPARLWRMAQTVRRALPAQIVSRMREKKLTYIRNFHPGTRLGRSWQSAYWTEDRAEAESIIAAQGSTYQWAENGSLRVSTVCDALTRHPVTGDEVWFNQAEMYHPSCCTGSASPARTGIGQGPASL